MLAARCPRFFNARDGARWPREPEKALLPEQEYIQAQSHAVPFPITNATPLFPAFREYEELAKPSPFYIRSRCTVAMFRPPRRRKIDDATRRTWQAPKKYIIANDARRREQVAVLMISGGHCARSVAMTQAARLLRSHAAHAAPSTNYDIDLRDIAR